MRLLFLVIASCLSIQVSAQNFSEVKPGQPDSTSSGQTAAAFQPTPQEIYQQWDLSAQEWREYKRLMQGPLGARNPNLEPPLALAHAAKSESEARRYLRVFIKNEQAIWDRGKEIERMHREELFSMYPDQYPIDRNKLYQNDDVVRRGDRFLLVVNSACAECQKTASALVTATKVFNNSFDIYVQDTNKDQVVVQWAKEALDPHQLEDGRVTLNARDPYLSDLISNGSQWALFVRRGNRLFPASAFELLAERRTGS